VDARTRPCPGKTTPDPRNDLLRAALQARTGLDWSSTRGIDLYHRIEREMAGPISRELQRSYGLAVDSWDLVHTAVESLAAGSILRYVQGAEKPWAYLYAVLRQSALDQAWGLNGPCLDSLADDLATAPESHLTPMPTVVDLTVDTVLRHAPRLDSRGVLDTVWFYADVAPDRASRSRTLAASDEALLRRLEADEIRAIGNIALGGRATATPTSLFAGYLVDETWIPEDSDIHQSALRKFARRLDSTPLLIGA